MHEAKPHERLDRKKDVMKKFHKSDLLVHPLAAGELSLGEVTA
jgi:hypothetical protein